MNYQLFFYIPNSRFSIMNYLILPTEEELQAEIERERELIVREQQMRYGEGEVNGWELEQGT